MKDKDIRDNEKLKFNNFVKEKEIDSESSFVKVLKKNKKTFILLASSFFILIMAILNINGLVKYTGGVNLNQEDFAMKNSAVIGENKTKLNLKESGKVEVISKEYKDKINNIDTWNDIVSIDGGYNYVVGLSRDGRVKACGNNDIGQCNTDSWENVVKLMTGSEESRFTVALKSDGTVLACGDNAYGQCNVSSWNDVVDISTGDNHTVALKSDGTVVACGKNDNGECDVSDFKDIKSINAYENYTEGIKSNGDVVSTASK